MNTFAPEKVKHGSFYYILTALGPSTDESSILYDIVDIVVSAL